MKVRKIPMRKCVGCNEQSPKKEMVRIVRRNESDIQVDLTGRMNGRGAYLHPSWECLQNAMKKRSLERALECDIPEEVFTRLQEEFHER